MEKTWPFPKRERITSQKLIDHIFGGGRNKSFAAFPLRAVWMVTARGSYDEPLQVLVSVPKKRLHHAVDRNRAKRQVREAWRLQKQVLLEKLPADKRLVVALMWQSDHEEATSLVHSRIGRLLNHIAETL